MQLEWEGDEFMQAHTPFGSYTVQRRQSMGWWWGYCFDEYYDEENYSCESAEEGKRLANEHWQDRIAPIIAPYLPPPPRHEGITG